MGDLKSAVVLSHLIVSCSLHKVRFGECKQREHNPFALWERVSFLTLGCPNRHGFSESLGRYSILQSIIFVSWAPYANDMLRIGTAFGCWSLPLIVSVRRLINTKSNVIVT
jgi:hypothetical protein